MHTQYIDLVIRAVRVLKQSENYILHYMQFVVFMFWFRKLLLANNNNLVLNAPLTLPNNFINMQVKDSVTT